MTDDQLLDRVAPMTSKRKLEKLFGKLDGVPTAVSLADPSKEDMPLIYVNLAFMKMTGYSHDDVVGKNCRFLQGSGTNPGSVARLREAIREGRQTFNCILNYRKTGEAFHNMLMLSPVSINGGDELILGCQYKFALADSNLHIREHLEELEGVAEKLGPQTGAGWILRKKTMELQTRSIKTMVDSYISLETYRQANAEIEHLPS